MKIWPVLLLCSFSAPKIKQTCLCNFLFITCQQPILNLPICYDKILFCFQSDANWGFLAKKNMTCSLLPSFSAPKIKQTCLCNFITYQQPILNLPICFDKFLFCVYRAENWGFLVKKIMTRSQHQKLSKQACAISCSSHVNNQSWISSLQFFFAYLFSF